MKSMTSNNPYRSLPAGICLFLVFMLLLAACGKTNAGPTPTPPPSFATQADAFFAQQVAIIPSVALYRSREMAKYFSVRVMA